MSAPNALGLQCPVCERGDKISILAEVWLNVTPEGTEPEQNCFLYTSDSFAECGCGHAGKLRGFATN